VLWVVLDSLSVDDVVMVCIISFVWISVHVICVFCSVNRVFMFTVQVFTQTYLLQVV